MLQSPEHAMASGFLIGVLSQELDGVTLAPTDPNGDYKPDMYIDALDSKFRVHIAPFGVKAIIGRSRTSKERHILEAVKYVLMTDGRVKILSDGSDLAVIQIDLTNGKWVLTVEEIEDGKDHHDA